MLILKDSNKLQHEFAEPSVGLYEAKDGLRFIHVTVRNEAGECIFRMNSNGTLSDDIEVLFAELDTLIAAGKVAIP